MRRKNTIKSVDTETSSTFALEATEYETAYNAFIRMCTVRNLSSESQKYYKTTLQVLFRTLQKSGIKRPIDVTKEALEDAIIERKNNVSDASVNMYLRSWRAFFRFLHEEGYIPNNPAENIRLIKAEKRIIQTFSRQQIKKLIDIPNKSEFTGYRDYVIMLTLLDTGIRISELENLKITDINWKERTLKVFGKGRKERIVPFQKTLEKHLKEYIAIRGPLDHDYIFVNIDNGPLRKRSMQDNLRKYGKEAGIKDVRVSPHTFRHTFAKNYITAGGDAFSLMKLLGHTTLEMTQNYVNLFGVDIAKQHAKYSPLERILDSED